MTHEDEATGADGSNTHHRDDQESVSFAVLTVSSSRSLETDESGDAIVETLENADHTVEARDLVTDETGAIRDCVEAFLEDDGIDAVITTGGTGLTADDVTPEAIAPRFDRKIPGFGEQFRARSVEEVGPHGMLTRTTAGVVGDTPIFCLPGSEDAAAFGTAELVVPIVGHVVALASEHGHDQHSSAEGSHDQHSSAGDSHDQHSSAGDSHHGHNSKGQR